MRCYVPCCINAHRARSKLTKIEKIRFHKFPINNAPLFKKWKEIIFHNERSIPNITVCSGVCSLHFRDCDYAKKDKKSNFNRYLKKTAVPSIRLTEDESDYLSDDDDETSKNCEEDVNNSKEGSESSANDIADDTDLEVADTIGENSKVVTSNLEHETSIKNIEISINEVVNNFKLNTETVDKINSSQHADKTQPAEICFFDKMECEPQQEEAVEPSVRELCRVCAGNGGDMVDIFSNQELLDNIKQFLPINVQTSDLLPLQVCDGCVAWLESCRLLVESCVLADTELQRRLTLVTKPPVLTEDLDCLDVEIHDTEHQHLDSPDDISSQTLPLCTFSETDDQKKELEGRNCKFKCKICNFQSDDLFQFDVHMINHNKYWCKKCDINFNTFNDFKLHKDETHKIKCSYCDVVTEKEYYYHHFKRYHRVRAKFIKLTRLTNDSGNCKMCSFTYTNKFTVKKHYFWKHSKHACDICLELFDNSEKQIQHTEEVHMIPCPYCSDKNYSYDTFQIHLNEKHKGQSSQKGNVPKTSLQIYECEFCKKGLTSKAFVRKHYYWSHFQYKCIICLQTFKTAELEEKHFKSHGNICICCEENFSTPEILSDHINSQHPNFKPFSCEDCGDEFDSRNELNLHRTVHKLPEKYVCNQCGKILTTARGLKIHKYTHISINKSKDEEEGRVECDYCSKKFKFKWYLKRHLMTVHTFHYKDCKC